MSNLLGLEDEKENVSNRWPEEELGPDPELATRMKNGASWFYWIAGLSVINSLIFIFGADVAFLAGLGLTQLMDGIIDLSIESGAPSMLKAVAIVFDLVLFVVFALAGYYARKRFTAAFVIGIGIYVLDGLLLLLLGLYLSAGFHAFAMFFIVRGFLACRKLNAYNAAKEFQMPPPSPAV